jgi:thymidylate synthase
MYQRSADIGLGLPFNIASYAVLTYMLAKLTNLKPKKLSITIGDAHIYENHFEALKEQIRREPYEFPKLELNLEKEYNKIEDFDINDFKIINYKYCEHLKMEMIA